MITTAQNNNHVDLNEQVLQAPMPLDVFLKHLHASLGRKFPENPLPRARALKRNDNIAAIKYFEGFCLDRGSDIINPSEQLMEELLGYLVKTKGPEKRKYALSLTNHIRNLINLFPPAILNRPIVTPKKAETKKWQNNLSTQTVDFLTDFTKSGKKLNRKRHQDGQPILSNQLLSPCRRELLAWRAGFFLRKIKKNCLLSVTPQDAENFVAGYEQKGQRDLGLQYLSDLQSIFQNLAGKNLISANPIAAFNERKKSKIDDDFIMPDGIETLRDLTTVDFQDFNDVRNRMLSFVLFYDFCLRRSEAALLKISDVTIVDNLIEIVLRSEIQKGQNKPKVTIYNYFEESKKLMQAYLDLRTKAVAGRDTDALLVQRNGKPLGAGGCNDAVTKQCQTLNIKTHQGNNPYPHCLRHTFATINIDQIGLCLTPYTIQARLRHADLSTTIKVYVTNNPLLAKQNHMAHLDRLKTTHNGNNITTAPCVKNENADIADFSLPETDAVRAVRHLHITADSLRQYATNEKLAKSANSKIFYSANFINDISKNYVTKNQVMKRLKFGKSRFYVWKKSRAIEPIVIGKTSLVKATDVL